MAGFTEARRLSEHLFVSDCSRVNAPATRPCWSSRNSSIRCRLTSVSPKLTPSSK